MASNSAPQQDQTSWLDLEPGFAMNEELYRRWQEAIEKSKSRLSSEDRQIAERLKTPEDILEDLKRRQGEQGKNWLGQARGQLAPFLKSLHSFSMMLVVAMLPHSIETSLAWGLLSIILQLGFMTEARSQKMVETLNAVRKVLLKVNRYAGGDLRNEEEVKEVLVDIHEKLLEFWVKVVKELRKHPLERMQDTALWKDINGSLSSTLAEIEKHYDNIRDLASSTATLSNNLALRQTKAEPAVIFPVMVLPIPDNPKFFGREDTLQLMHEHLDPAQRKVRLSCFTLYGMGGIGKTQVAASYSYKHCQNDDDRSYDAVFWIASETTAGMHQSFSSIALTLKLSGIDERSDPSAVLRAVHSWLKHTDKRWLLIFDNAERWSDIMPDFWPQAGAVGAIIVTSRDFNLSYSPASAGEELRVFSSGESLDFAKSILRDWESNDEDECHALSQLLSNLDGLPLAIHQISSLINVEGSSVADFLELYNEYADEFHKDRGGDHQAFYSFSLDTVWLMAINTFAKRPESQLLLGSICLLSPDSIPEKLFQARKTLPLPDDALLCRNTMKVRKILRDLRASGIISISKSTIRIHRLLQSAFLKRVDFDIQDHIFQVTATLLNDVFPKQHLGDPLYEHWAACSQYILHAQVLAKNWSSACDDGHAFQTSVDFLELLSHAAWYFRELGDYENSIKLVDIGVKAAGGHHEVLIAHLLNTAGVSKELRYDYVLSRKDLEKSLEIRSRVLGDDHLETTGVKQNLASIIAAQGQYNEALKLYQEAELASTRFSAQEKRLASCRYAANYGRCFIELGQLEEARSSLVRSLEILNSGNDNPVYRRAIEYCFGNLNLAEGNLRDAKTNYEKCLNGYPDGILEKNQLLSCGCCYKLSLIEMELGNTDAALTHLQSAMKWAQELDSQGYTGRILLLKADFARKHALDPSKLEESEEEINLRISAVRSNLEGIMSGHELLENPNDIFMLFVPWQVR
ncbi:Fc.00g112950.m01.CDS01 [Cosmosporella sp. VM-42]